MLLSVYVGRLRDVPPSVISCSSSRKGNKVWLRTFDDDFCLWMLHLILFFIIHFVLYYPLAKLLSLSVCVCVSLCVCVCVCVLYIFTSVLIFMSLFQCNSVSYHYFHSCLEVHWALIEVAYTLNSLCTGKNEWELFSKLPEKGKKIFLCHSHCYIWFIVIVFVLF